MPVKRALVLTGLLAIAAVGGALAYRSAARDRSYRALIASGEAALTANDTLAAIEDFSGAIALRPDAMLARLRRGVTYRRRGDLDIAARDFRFASALDPTATRPLEALGDVLFAQERYKRAAETYEARLRLDDQSAPVRYKLALARYRDGAVDAALADARAAMVIDDQLADAPYLAAMCLREKGRAGEALAMLQTVVTRAPGMVAAREELADMLAAAGRYPEQLEQLQALASLEENRGERQIAIGVAQAKAGRPDLAISTLTAALPQAADQSALNAALGRVWLELFDEGRERQETLTRALEALERAASALTATSETKALYGRALMLSGQLDAAEQLFQQAVERYPVDPGALRQLSAVAQQLGHAAIARKALVDYAALEQPDTYAADDAARIGALSLTLNDAAGALPWLRRAVALKPDDVGLLVSVAEAELQTGDASQARATIARARALEPENRRLAALDRRLRRAGS
jgi:tetratricopeptide (TPR) repeat protein